MATSVTPRLPPREIALALRRDLFDRTTTLRLIEGLRARLSVGDELGAAARAYEAERQLRGVIEAGELLHRARVGGRDRAWSGMVPVGRFADLPNSQPVLRADTVALAAAALEGRLLALLAVNPANAAPGRAPDETLAAATDYSRSTVRKALRETLSAIGLDTGDYGMPRYPARSVGTTKPERDAAKRRKKRAMQATRRRARARSADAVAAERERLDAEVAEGRIERAVGLDGAPLDGVYASRAGVEPLIEQVVEDPPC